MLIHEKPVVFQIFQRLEAAGNQDHRHRVLRALKQLDDGTREVLKNNYLAAVEQHESALQQLKPVDEAAVLRAMVKGRLVAEYGGLGRVAEAITSGREAIDELGRDPRLESSYAECLLNLGAVLAYSDPNESIAYLERAKLIYETRADGRDALAVCQKNIELARSNLGRAPKQSRSKAGWWSRFMGKN